MPRSVWLRRGHERDDATDGRTITVGSLFGVPFGREGLRAGVSGSFSDLFHRHYPNIRTLLNAHPEPGLGLLLASDDGVEASAWWPAHHRDANPLIVGRHSAAEVFVPSDPCLSLRHLVVLVHPLRDTQTVRYRVLDLRTPTAFRDEEGQRLEALEADGPLMLRCASFAALLFPTGTAEEPWPVTSDAGWARIPERVHLERRTAHPERWRDRAVWAFGRHTGTFGASGGAPTLSTSFPGPSFAVQELAGSDPVRGEILVRSSAGRASIRLGAEAARQGILLGRYDRCDNAGIDVLADEALSRVHVLLIEMAGAFYAVDTASKNGMWEGLRRVRLVRIEPGRPLTLAHKATVSWRPFH